MDQRNIDYEPVQASRYAKGLLSHTATHEPQALTDKLTVPTLRLVLCVNALPNLLPHGKRTLQSFTSHCYVQKSSLPRLLNLS